MFFRTYQRTNFLNQIHLSKKNEFKTKNIPKNIILTETHLLYLHRII
jgi:hypothetical protein